MTYVFLQKLQHFSSLTSGLPCMPTAILATLECWYLTCSKQKGAPLVEQVLLVVWAWQVWSDPAYPKREPKKLISRRSK